MPNLQDKWIPGLHKNSIMQFPVMVCVLKRHYFGYCQLSGLELIHTAFQELALNYFCNPTPFLADPSDHAVLRHGSAATRLLRLWVQIPPGVWMFICCECCVLSGRGLCDELITCPEESYRLVSRCV